jgi:hypothetical protein
MPVKADLNIASYDFRDPEQATLFREQNIERMKRNVADKLKDLEAKGIIDKDGRRIRTDTPPDMLPDSGADVGG